MNLSRTAVILGIVGLSISFPAVTMAEEKGLSPLEQCYQSVGDSPRTKIAGCLGAKLNAANTPAEYDSGTAKTGNCITPFSRK